MEVRKYVNAFFGEKACSYVDGASAELSRFLSRSSNPSYFNTRLFQFASSALQIGGAWLQKPIFPTGEINFFY